MKRNARKPLDAKDARPMGVDSKGTMWVDGNAKGIKTQPATETYRANYERIRWPESKGE